MKRIWKILIVLAVLGLIGAGYGYYQYTRPHRDLASARPDITIGAPALLKAFADNEQGANKQYLNKVINVRGVLKSVDKDSTGVMTLSLDVGDPMSTVSCQLAKEHSGDAATVKAGDSVSVIGACSGYLSDVMPQVVLDRCALELKSN